MSFFDFLEAFQFGGMDDHHILQKTIFDDLIFEQFGLFQDQQSLAEFRDADENLMQLSRNRDVAEATGTPRHAGNHAWIADEQARLIRNFRTDFSFGGLPVNQLLADPDLDPIAFEQARAYFRDQYLPDIRDQTAKGLIDGDLHLTAQDASLPAGTTTADLTANTQSYLSDDRFSQSPTATFARETDLADFRAARQEFVDAGGDARFIAFNDPDKVRALVDASDSAGVAPFKRSDAAAFDRLVGTVDDGNMEAFTAEYIRNKKIPPSIVNTAGIRLGGLIGIGALVAAFGADVAFAANSDTVEERDTAIQDAVVALGIEVTAVLLFAGAAPQAVAAVVAYVIYKAVTDEEFREVLFDAADTYVALAPQVVTRFFTGEQVFPSDDSLMVQHVSSPGSPYVPIVSGFAPLPPSDSELSEAGIERYEAFVFRLAEASDVYSLQVSDIGFSNSNDRFPVSVLDKDGIPIALVVTEDGLPASLYDPEASGNIAINSFMPIVTTPADGMFVVTPQDGWGVLDGQELEWLGSSDGIEQLGLRIENLLAVNAQRTRLQSETFRQKNINLGSTTATYRVYSTWAAEEAVAVRVADNGFDTPTNSNSIINIRREGRHVNIWLDHNEQQPANRASTSANPIEQRWGQDLLNRPNLSEIELFIALTPNGFEIYEFGRKIENPTPEQIEKVNRLYGVYETTLALNPFDAEERDAGVVSRTPRDLSAAEAGEGGAAPLTILVGSISDTVSSAATDDRIISISSRLVAARLQQELEQGGQEEVTNDDFDDLFVAALRGQAREIYTAGSVGRIFGSALGNAIASDDQVESLVLSGTLGAITESIGQAIGTGLASDSLSQGFDTGLAELPYNLGNAAVGALSSLLTAELVNAVGVDGVIGDLANTAAGAVIGQIAQNLVNGVGSFADLFNGVQIGTAVASFVGSKLAAEVVSFDTVGGQIGSSIGSSLGVIAAAELFKVGALAGPLGAAIGAFAGYVLGGLVGSVFGGTPRSGADASWDAESGHFVANNIYSRKGGSKEAAAALATVAADTFNAVLDATGGRVQNPTAITTGNYGMRKGDFVYRATSARSKDAITFRVSPKDHDDAFEQLTRHGIWQGLSDPDFAVVGGNIFVKRALYRTIESNASSAEFDQHALLANLQLARDWSFYRSNTGAVEAIANALDENERREFLAGWVVTAARVKDLGLDLRHKADWFGGYNALLVDAETNAAHVSFSFDYDFRNEKFSRLHLVDGRAIYDSVNVTSQTMLDGSEAGDVIDLRDASISDWEEFTINGDSGSSIANFGVHYTSNLLSNVSIAGTGPLTAGSITASSTANAVGREFNIGLLNSTGARGVGRDAVVTIVDQDDLPYLLVSDAHINEAASHFVFRVNFSRSLVENATLKFSFGNVEATDTHAFEQVVEYSIDHGGSWQLGSEAQLSIGSNGILARISASEFEHSERRGIDSVAVFGVKVVAGQDHFSNSDILHTGHGHIWDHASHEPLVWVDNQVVHGGAERQLILQVSGSTGNSATAELRVYDRSEYTVSTSTTVTGLAGNDTVHASSLGDNVLGGDGNDTLYGGRLDDWLLGGDGNDVLNAGAETGGLGGDGNYLDGGAGNDTLVGREGSDWLEGGDGVDTLSGGAGGDILTGGGSDGDTLFGGAGDDNYLLRLGDGADLVTDTNNQSLAWDTANDDYLGSFNESLRDLIAQRYDSVRDGNGELLAGSALGTWAAGQYAGNYQDWLGNYTPGISSSSGAIDGGDDSVVLGQGIGIGDVQLQRSGTVAQPGDDLIINVMTLDANGVEVASGDSLALENWFASPFDRIEWLRFADGNEIRIGDFTSLISGTNGDDTLIGTLGNDFVYGGGGDDTLFLLAGDDIGNGGTGSDFVSGDSGEDLIVGGSGADILSGEGGNDTLSGDGGDDQVFGGAGNDLLSGGRGDDTLVGGAGNDTFKYSRGDGHDIVVDEVAGTWQDAWTRTGGWNSAAGFSINSNGDLIGPGGAVLRENVGTADLPEIQWNGRLEYDSLGETLRFFAPATSGSTVADSGTDTVEFDPTIHIRDLALENRGNDLVVHISNDGGESGSFGGADSITLSQWNNGASGSIENLAFFSTGTIDLSVTNLIAGTADDDAALLGTSGANWITGGAGSDDITGNSADDILSGNGGADTIAGAEGDDVLYGGSGDDVLIGGDGADLLVGGSGSDWASYEDDASGIYFNLAAVDLATGSASGDSLSSVENVRGGSGADEIVGDVGDNILDGGAGNDILRGSEGNDTYIWDGSVIGSDTIQEGQASVNIAILGDGSLAAGYTAAWESVGLDGAFPEPNELWQYRIRHQGSLIYDDPNQLPRPDGLSAPTDQRDTSPQHWLQGYLQEATNGAAYQEQLSTSQDAGEDTLELAEGMYLASLTFALSGSDLVITHSGGASVTIQGQLTTGGRVETLQLHDGLAARLNNLILAGNGGSDDDFIFGNASNNVLSGDAGDDVLFGGTGNDNLAGNAGDDVIEGGAGNDTLSGGSNSLTADNPNSWGDTVRYTGSSTGVTVNLNLSAQVSGGDAQGDTLSGFENIEGSFSFDDTLTGDDSANRIFGHGGSDNLFGNGGDDVLVGGEGDDQLDGGAGEDNLSGDDGNDILDGGGENDLLVGGSGRDTLTGGSGDDQLLGGDGDESGSINSMARGLFGGAGNDFLDGGAGNDELEGGADDDTLIGGSGNDSLDGGAGDDTYAFYNDGGDDTVFDMSGDDTIVFLDEVNRNQLWMQQVGDDLQISIIGSDTQVNIDRFFAATNSTLIETVQTADGTLFLTDPEALTLIADMTAHSGSIPIEMPDLFSAQIERVWSEGTTPAPRAPETPQLVEITTLTPNAFNTDLWPRNAPTGRSFENLVNEEAWPRDIDDLPTAGTLGTGWTGYLAETSWVDTEAPYARSLATHHAGDRVVSLLAGQTNTNSAPGGGAQTNPIAIDKSKAYEFSAYFKVDALGQHHIFFGMGGDVEWGHSTGTDNINPYFISQELPSAGLGYEADKWYKFVGYVLPDGSEEEPVGSYGGIYDTETGEKLRDVNHFVWDASRSTTTTNLRFFNYYGQQNAGQFTHFFQPELREVTDTRYILGGDQRLNVWQDSTYVGSTYVEGNQNLPHYNGDGDSRWIEVLGPDGNPITALEAGQFDDNPDGGGQFTNNVTIDRSKTYRYVQYFRKSDLETHSVSLAVLAGSDEMKRVETGQNTRFGYFTHSGHGPSGWQQQLTEDEWFMAVGYVFADGSLPTDAEDYGGIFRASDGAKVADVYNFQWDSGTDPLFVQGLYFTHHGGTERQWTTQFLEPSFGVIDQADVAASNADPFGNSNNWLGEPVTIDASLGVTDYDNNITSWALDPNGTPANGEIVSVNETTGSVVYRPFASALGEDGFSVVAIDAGGNQTIVPIEVNLTLGNVNEAPIVPIDGYDLELAENSALGTVVGALTATDPGETVEYLFDNALMVTMGGTDWTFSNDRRFKMNRATGEVLLNEGSFDFEFGQGAFNYDVRIRNRAGSKGSRSVYTSLAITIGDVNELHTMAAATLDIAYFERALGPLVPVPDMEGRAINLVSLMLDDPEGQNLSWSLVNQPANPVWSLAIDGTLHQVDAITASSTHSLTVRATDSDGNSQDAVLTLNVGADDGSADNLPVFSPVPGYGDFSGIYGYNYLPPVILDLDGDGVELLTIDAGVQFDMDSNGTLDRTGWFSPDDAVLAIDENANGIVDNGSEINFQRFIEGAFSDLEGLAFFDTNANGLFDNGDARWGEFVVWQDLNSDGVSQADELRSLDDAGLVSINLTGSETGQEVDGTDNVIFATSTYETTSGTIGEVGDVFFVFDPATPDTTPPPEPPIVDDPADTPDSDAPATYGFGSLSYGEKSKRYRLSSRSGSLFIGPRGSNRMVDQRAGLVAGPTYFAFRNRTFGMLSAVVLDLDGDGLETRRYKKTRAAFDMDGNGSRDNVGWTTSNDGFLVIDRNDNGRVDDATEMAFLDSDGNLQNGQAGLFALDTNGDGIVSADDELFSSLQIWVDSDGDGVTDIGEMQSLASRGIESISLAFAGVEETKRFGRNLTLATTVFTRTDGSTGTAGDIAFGFVPSDEPAPAVQSSVTPRMLAIEDGLAQFAGLSIEDMSLDALMALWPDGVRNHDRLDTYIGTTGGDFPLPVLAVRHEEERSDGDGVSAEDVEPAHIQPDNGLDATAAARLALLRQNIAVFGSDGGVEDFGERRYGAYAPLDYFA